jgi:hypothetical protein
VDQGGRDGDEPSLKAVPLGENVIKCMAAIEAIPGH